uniref:EF-hand domain-containing protein n=1 Tax=Emiliania huxleyi TaxID=2903 RepID=A0A7S3RUJ8_EMIHU|mmetsp:Transcript_17765/g.52591  ORF Transcript_17765/g.52591 Transcript_17765/m.52591 type:complete len:281 (+) Transcript_17765:59-901(+)
MLRIARTSALATGAVGAARRAARAQPPTWRCGSLCNQTARRNNAAAGAFAFAAGTGMVGLASCDASSELEEALSALSAEGLCVAKESLVGYQKVFHDMGAGEGEGLSRAQIEAHVAKTTCERSRKVKQISEIVFHVFDHDGSGMITFPEFAAGLALIKASKERTCSEATKEFAWRCLDHEHTGFIRRREVLAWVKLLTAIGGLKADDKEKASMLGCVSLNSSGGFRRQVSPDELTSKYMKILDPQRKGQISKEEFFSHMDEVLDMMAVHQLLDPYVTKAV